MSSFKISLKPNERIYINGAVIRVDRRTSLEFLNDVQFLLDSHVLQAEDANTPLKRLYFTIQIQLMTPNDAADAKHMFNSQLGLLLQTFEDPHILTQLKEIDRMTKEGRCFEALKTLRGLFAAERRIFEAMPTSFPFELATA